MVGIKSKTIGKNNVVVETKLKNETLEESITAIDALVKLILNKFSDKMSLDDIINLIKKSNK